MSENEPERWANPTQRIQRPATAARPDIGASIDAVRSALEGLRFGSITLTVHDARVVQLDVTEKQRFA